MNRLLQITVLGMGLCFGTLAMAYDYNTSDYQSIREMKAWTTHIDVYLSNHEEHACSGGLKTRFLLEPDKDHLYRLLLSAFLSGKSVQLAYSCRSGFPWIDGIRMR